MALSNLPKTLIEYLVAFSCVLGYTTAQYTSTFPGSIPLVHRSPWFNAWMAGDEKMSMPGGITPTFWNGRSLGWSGLVRVDGKTFAWQGPGQADQNTTTKAVFISPTRTIFTVAAGPINLNITYLSPIEPSDYVLQSFPFAYLAIDAVATDGGSHKVQLFTNVNGQFVSNDDLSTIQWTNTQTNQSIYHEVKRTNPPSKWNNLDMAEDGILYYGTSRATAGVTWKIGSELTVRTAFETTGALDNKKDDSFRPIFQDTPIMAYAVDLGTVSSTLSPTIVFAIGLVRDPIITYTTTSPGGSQMRNSFFWTRYSKIGDAIDAFIADYSAASQRAINLDNKIMADAGAISPEYADMVAISFRQTLGAVEITTTRDSNTLVSYDVMAFMKDVGNSWRVNAVETLYAAFPAYLYYNATLAGALLRPLLDYQSAYSQYPNPYAAPDIGGFYPDASGNNTNQVSLGIENSANMLIMLLAYLQKTGDSSFLSRYSSVIFKWSDYLSTNLGASGFISSDGLRIDATSNLQLKGIIGMFAAAVMEPQISYSYGPGGHASTATNYLNQWKSRSFTTGHISSADGNPSTWGLIYDLFSARLLDWSSLPVPPITDDIYAAQAAFYSSAPDVPPFGLPYDYHEPQKVKSHWTLLSAASLKDANASRRLIAMTHAKAFAYVSKDSKPNPTIYDAKTGLTYGGVASPAQGAAFGILSLKLPAHAATPLSTGPVYGSGGASTIVGIVLGTLLPLLFLAGAIYWFIRRRKQRRPRAVVRVVGKPFLDSPRAASPLIGPISTITPFVDDAATTTTSTLREPSTIGTSSMYTSGKRSAAVQEQQHDQVELTSLFPTDRKTRMPTWLNIMSTKTRPPSTVSGPSSASTSAHPPPDTDNLRREVEELRMEVAMLKNNRRSLAVTDEQPPQYIAHVTEPSAGGNR